MANKTPSPSYTAEIDYNKRGFVTCNLSICNCATYNVFWIYPPILTSITTTISSSSSSILSQNSQFISKSRPQGFENAILTPLIDAEETPTYLFYRIDKNAVVPVVDAAGWNLNVKGLVNNPLTLNYEEIKAMNNVEQYATLSCVSNKIGGDLNIQPYGKEFT